jgi:hypothetical protein
MAIVDERTEKQKKNDKRNALIFTVYIGISAFFLIGIETEFNAPFFFTFKYLALPIFIIVGAISIKYPYIFCYKSDGVLFCSIAILFIMPMVIIIGSMGYVSFFNVILPPQETVYYKGIIKEKFISGASRKSYVIALDIDDDERRFSVSEEEYNKLKLGQFYKIKMKKGGLGIVYKINW